MAERGSGEPGTPLRVLVVERSGTGGIAQYAHAFSGALAARGHTVDLLSPPRDPMPPAGAPYHLEERLVRNIGFGRAKATAREARNAAVSLASGLRRRPDLAVVHAPSPGRLDELWLRPLRRAGVGTVWEAHDLAQYEWGGVLKPFARRLYRSVDGFVTLSEAEHRKLAGQLPDVAARAAVIPHGDSRWLAGERLEQSVARAKLGIDPDPAEPVVLFFGYVKDYKGIDDLVDALSRLRAGAVPVRAIVAGRVDGPAAEAALRASFASAGVADLITLRAGFVPDDEVPALFAAADAVVQPYRDATQSGVTQLAYAYGRPVVVTDVGGLAEDVEPGVTGAVAAARDPASLADAIAGLVRDRDALSAMHARLAAGPPQRHSWDTVMDAHMTLFDRVLRERR